MTDTHNSSLADNLRRLFEQAVAAPNLDNETGIKTWGEILNIDDDARVMELALFILKGLRQLQTALELESTIKFDTKSRYQKRNFESIYCCNPGDYDQACMERYKISIHWKA
jgi:hypothetical protein